MHLRNFPRDRETTWTATSEAGDVAVKDLHDGLSKFGLTATSEAGDVAVKDLHDGLSKFGLTATSEAGDVARPPQVNRAAMHLGISNFRRSATRGHHK